MNARPPHRTPSPLDRLDRASFRGVLFLGLLTAIVVVFCAGLLAPVHATFSITAVDPQTGQVGSAGASCIAGSIILSDVHPGVGCVHTQAYWNNQNQQYARSLMNQGYAPAAIVDSVVAHDAQGNPTIRQYGIVDLQGGGRSAAYTGVNCTDWKGHLLGPTYAIQGNILLGPGIVDDMETAFLNTPGTLADKLMASLQAAKVPGADTRCLAAGKSSISAFLRVALPSDPVNDLFLDLNVNNTAPSQDPIDLLQDLYDDWLQATDAYPAAGSPAGTVTLHPNRPNPFRSSTVVSWELPSPARVTLKIYDVTGREVATLVDGPQSEGLHRAVWTVPALPAASGLYFCRLVTGDRVQTRKMLLLAP